MGILNAERKGATEYTRQWNKKQAEQENSVFASYEETDVNDFKRHFIKILGADNITDNAGKILWNRKKQDSILQEEIPDTVNPYLWKSCKELYLAGVVEAVKDKVYTVVGVDCATVGFVRGKTGWIILDTGSSEESANVTTGLVEAAIGKKVFGNVRAIITTHTHWDHFAGAGAFTKAAGNGTVKVYAPAEWEQSLIDDNLYAGVAMARRTHYQGGCILPRDTKGCVSTGLTGTTGIFGTETPLHPDEVIEKDQTLEIDGLHISFLLTPNTETRAHMCVYIDDYQTLFLGDNSPGMLHNTYTMRGAPVRDSNFWGKVFYQLYLKWGNTVEVIIPGHGLSHWKQKERPDKLKEFLLDNAAAYKFTHDQALLYANKGYNLTEIGNYFKIPDEISRVWYVRPHYGEYSFNARGVYQKYLGYYDGNPVNLLPLPRSEKASKIIEYIGSEELVLEKAQADFEKGQYQWVAEITSCVVYKNPKNLQARYLCADALEQLGYQAESSLWRNAYLSGALELRNPGFAEKLTIDIFTNKRVIPGVSVDLILDHLGINIDGEKAIHEKMEFVLEVTDEKPEAKFHIVKLYKGTLFHENIRDIENWNAELTINLPVVKTTHNGVYQLSIHKYAENRELFEGERIDLLEKLDQYIVDTQQYRNFNLIEPIS